jgi:hypothetical protein
MTDATVTRYIEEGISIIRRDIMRRGRYVFQFLCVGPGRADPCGSR